jgi:hypothetical protein
VGEHCLTAAIGYDDVGKQLIVEEIGRCAGDIYH